jgi:hypothetical protein
MYSEVSSDDPIDLCRDQVENCYMDPADRQRRRFRSVREAIATTSVQVDCAQVSKNLYESYFHDNS